MNVAVNIEQLSTAPFPISIVKKTIEGILFAGDGHSRKALGLLEQGRKKFGFRARRNSRDSWSGKTLG